LHIRCIASEQVEASGSNPDGSIKFLREKFYVPVCFLGKIHSVHFPCGPDGSIRRYSFPSNLLVEFGDLQRSCRVNVILIPPLPLHNLTKLI